VSDAAGDKEQVLLPGDFVLNRRLRTVKLTNQGMKHALRYLRAFRLSLTPMLTAVTTPHTVSSGMHLWSCAPTVAAASWS